MFFLNAGALLLVDILRESADPDPQWVKECLQVIEFSSVFHIYISI